jgi:hypothetical protein
MRMTSIRLVVANCLISMLITTALLIVPHISIAQELHRDSNVVADSDHDGLSDAVEQALLVQFEPKFLVGQHDCSNVPAQFEADVAWPTVEREDGTIYGQAFLAKSSTREAPVAELHFYHLWRRDCGGHGHPLDTEHVAVLVQGSNGDLTLARWTALYWYAAAHENTVCDVSQIARASTLDAVTHGAKVWISPGKHASYLNETLCQRGCGADRCEAMVPLPPGKIVNLGEAAEPMNGSTFVASAAWPLQGKMIMTNFPAGPVARLNTMPVTEIAWFNAGRHPAQGVIAISASTGGAIAESGENTTAAIDLAGDSTGNALEKSYRKTKHALGLSIRSVGDALHVTSKPDEKKDE